MATTSILIKSTTGADASVEAVKLYHMKLTLAYSSYLIVTIVNGY